MLGSSHTKVKRNASRNIWLVGGTLESISGCKLPSNRQVLSRFFHIHSREKVTIGSSASTTAREVLHFWQQARIPTRKEHHVIKKIKDFYHEWQDLQRSASRRSKNQIAKEERFKNRLGNLFDIAHENALSLITIEEDRLFLLAQREPGRRGIMGPVDHKLAKLEERRHQRQMVQERRERKEAVRKEKSKIVNLEEESSNNDGNEDSSREDKTDETPNPDIRKRKAKRFKIIGPEVASALDRTKVSDRNAVYVLAAAAQSLGHDTQDIVLNRESIRRSRRHHRETVAKEIQGSFPESCSNIPLTVHWDGKMLPAVASHEKTDRLAVLVSGEGIMKLLGVPTLPSGTGHAQADAVFRVLQEWKLDTKVQFMSSDTTASNTGQKAGACVQLQQMLQRKLFYLPCRHHIFELVVGSVFDALFEPSSGPSIKLFQRFRESWKTIDSRKYDTGMLDEVIAPRLKAMKGKVIAFVHNQLALFQPRHDYKELLQLALTFFVESPEESTNVIAPGAFHRARWMAKIIYSCKIYLFRSQFQLTKRELKSLREFNLFVLELYLNVWYTCPSAVAAPRNDLEFAKALQAYRHVNKRVSETALKCFSRHLWYCSETLTGLAFFDPEIPDNVKEAMVKALHHAGEESSTTFQIR